MAKTKIIILFFAISVLVLYTFYVLIPVTKGFDYFIEFAAALINKKQRADALRTKLSLNHFLLLQKAAYLSAVALCIMMALAIRYARYFHLFLTRVKGSFKSFVSAIHQSEKKGKIIFIISIVYIVVQSLWYMNNLYFTQDEAYTISNFVLPGPVAAISFYPYPNNHILFSIFCYPFSFLPIKPEIAFRLPSLIAIISTCFILYRLLLYYFTGIVAALLVMVFVFLLPVMVYSVFARGYSLNFLFTCLLMFALIRTLNDHSLYHRMLLCLFSILGLYTLPVFVYPFCVIFGIYFFYGIVTQKSKLIINAIVAGLVCVVCSLILYLPVIITSGGWRNFVEIIYVGYDKTWSLRDTPLFIEAIYGILFFEQRFLVILFFLIVAVTSFLTIRKNKNGKVKLEDAIFFCICLSGFLTPLLSFIIQRKMVGSRTHSYASLFFTGLTFISIKHAICEKWRQLCYVTVVVFIVVMSVAFAHKSDLLNDVRYKDETSDMFAEAMVNTGELQDTCYSFEVFYFAAAHLKYALNKRTLTVYQSQPGSPSTIPFENNIRYHWVITIVGDRSIDTDSLHKHYIPFIQRSDAVLWKRKNS